MRRLVAAAAVAACALASPARAGGDVDLSLAGISPLPPASLAMRVAQAQPPGGGDGAGTDSGTGGGDASAQSSLGLREALRARIDALTLPGGIAELEEKVVFKFDLGVGLDGGEPATMATLATGAPLDDGGAYERLRIYTLGDLRGGTRGLVFPSLSSYFAAQFRFNHERAAPSTAAPSVYDNGDVESLLIRTAYAEADGVFRGRWLRPLYVRAGRQFHYGAAIAHFDGVVVGYDRPLLSVRLFSGQRVSLYALHDDANADIDSLIAGVNVRVDLSKLERAPTPLAVSADAIAFDGVRHFEGSGALKWSDDVSVRAAVRLRNGDVARQTLAVRARISDVTTVHGEVDNRAADDWLYDLVVDRPAGDDDSRRYLALGPPLPRVRFGARAGTVLRDNVDLLARVAAAFEHRDRDEQPSSYSSTYVEGGVGFEARARRRIRLGLQTLGRFYKRESFNSDPDEPGVADALPADDGELGERSFVEGATSLEYDLGAHTFRASAEMYMRWYRWRSRFDSETLRSDFRGGGRFAVQGAAGSRFRLRAEYDVALAPIDLAPEIRSIKALRVIAEAAF